MGYDGWGWGVGMAMHGLFWLVLMGALVVAAVALVRYLWRIGGPGQQGGAETGGRGRALSILEERYAKGEIERDEFLKKKQDLS
jgi:putative membrane protein